MGEGVRMTTEGDEGSYEYWNFDREAAGVR